MFTQHISNKYGFGNVAAFDSYFLRSEIAFSELHNNFLSIYLLEKFVLDLSYTQISCAILPILDILKVTLMQI